MAFEHTENLWRSTRSETCDSAQLTGEVAADLVIIGGGFTGCAAALEAAGQDASVVLLEAQTIGHGGSGRNVGLVNAGLWLPPDAVIAALGDGPGRHLIEVLSEAPSQVFDLIARHDISCEATRNGTLHLAHAASGLRDLQNRHRQGNQFGAPLQLLDTAETARRTGSDIYHGALFDPRAGTVQPLSYCTGLARAAQQAGAQIYTGSAVTRLSRDSGQWRVQTAQGSVAAKAVLLATNAYFDGFNSPYAPAFVPVSYSQFATHPLPLAQRERILTGGEGCWDTALVMSSLRLDQSGRLIVGGIGNARGPTGSVHKQWATRKLAQIFPDLANLSFEHRWRGQIAMTGDHIPKIVEFGPDAFAVFGYSGRGIGPGTVFGTCAAKALLAGDKAALPIAAQQDHCEAFTGLRGAYYEAGSTLAHLVSAR
ncbi:FAD-binding oxidoreductase [Epibacterium ulvae]|uniref:NAD(P)/FAD-dependent oxidoreductase n=1 Tax=Epibacterium ulvae TaxID=1156985 RepID=UPI001BFC0795|nr:FAD-binding oxidoreductase [Epibacterium ulvae]MBT8153279.1 FAD-binding oxidoreductase [Epibacterium ulvae]